MREEKEEDFICILCSAFKNETIHTFQDIEDYFDGHPLSEIYYHNVLGILNFYLKKVKLYFSIEIIIHQNEKNKIIPTIDKLIVFLNDRLKVQEKIRPFEKVPTNEKNILIDLLYIDKTKNREYYESKLNTLLH